MTTPRWRGTREPDATCARLVDPDGTRAHAPAARIERGSWLGGQFLGGTRRAELFWSSGGVVTRGLPLPLDTVQTPWYAWAP